MKAKAEAEQVKARFDELLARTNKNDPKPKDVEALRRLLGEHKDLELWRGVRGLAGLAESHLLEHTPLSAGINECWRKRLDALRLELGYSEASGLEQMLISHACLCWLRLACMEMRYTAAFSDSIGLAQGLFYEKRLTAAQRRFTKAVESLSKVRQMAAELQRTQRRAGGMLNARTA